MSVTIAQIYSVRFNSKLALPKIIQDNIAKLRISPATYRPARPIQRQHNNYRPKQPSESENWREKALVDIVRRVKEREDPEYSDIFSIFNKVAVATLEKLSKDAVEKIKVRDETFRLRIATLLFDKAITQHAYAFLMADMALRIATVIPEMKEDIQAQISMFPKLYNLTETLTYPHGLDSDFDNKVIEWMKQKEKRKGYAKFMVELSLRGLVTEECVKTGLQNVVSQLKQLIAQPKTDQIDENVGQFSVFLHETAKLTKSPILKAYLSETLKEILESPREWTPGLSARCRFKMEDAFKLVQ
jgi:hypothetical protein